MQEKKFTSLDDLARRSATDRIATALKGLRFGSVEIIVHDGRIVQIERKERWRMDLDNLSADGQEN